MDTLRVARVRANVTAKDAAARIGVNAATVWRWEAGKSEIPAWAFMRLVELYDADPWGIDLSPRSDPHEAPEGQP